MVLNCVKSLMALALGSLQDHVKIICYYSPKRAKYTNEGCQSIKHNAKIETALKGRIILISAHGKKDFMNKL